MEVVREYTEAVYEELVGTIREIDERELHPLAEKLNDLLLTFGSWVGWLKIDYYLDCLSDYHRAVLDQHDTTVEKLDQLFADVDGVDFSYRDQLTELYSSTQDYRAYLDQLSALIAPGTGFTAAAVTAANGSLLDTLNRAKAKSETVYAEQISRSVRGELKASAMELIGDVLAIPKSIGSFIKDVASGKKVSAAVDGWKLIDAVISTGADLVAIAVIPIGLGLSKVTGNERMMGATLDEAKKARKVNGIKEWADRQADDAGEKTEEDYLDYGKFWRGVSVTAEVVDTGSEIIGIAKDAQEMSETVTGIQNAPKLSGEEKARQLINYFVTGDDGGFGPKTKYVAENPDVVKKIISANKESGFSKASKYWGYAKNVYGAWKDGDSPEMLLYEELLNQNDAAGLAKDISEPWEDLADELAAGNMDVKKTQYVTYDSETGEWKNLTEISR